MSPLWASIFTVITPSRSSPGRPSTYSTRAFTAADPSKGSKVGSPSKWNM